MKVRYFQRYKSKKVQASLFVLRQKKLSFKYAKLKLYLSKKVFFSTTEIFKLTFSSHIQNLNKYSHDKHCQKHFIWVITATDTLGFLMLTTLSKCLMNKA